MSVLLGMKFREILDLGTSYNYFLHTTHNTLRKALMHVFFTA